MISYPFISDLFKNVLSKSRAIDGRFFVCPFMGSEINSDELGQVIEDTFKSSRLERKYPLSLLLQTTIQGDFTKPGWENWSGVMAFLTASYYSGVNQVVNPNPSTKTSTHTIPQDWHDMKRCANSFIYVLSSTTRSKGLIKNKFRLDQERPQVISNVSQIGVDKASGVIMRFNWSVFNGCELEDYDLDEIDGIVIPEEDSHPEHVI